MIFNAKSLRYIVYSAMAVAIIGTVHACGGFGQKYDKVVPSKVSASGADRQITLKWNGVSSADTYNIYWSTTSGVTKSSGTKISGLTTTTYTHTGLTNGATYYYIVTAVNAIEEGNASSMASATPQAPTALPSAPTGVSAAAGDTKVDVSWNAVTGATSYNIYWSKASGVTTGSTQISGITNAAYAHTGLTNGTAYYYIVTAVNAIGESAASSEVSASPASGGGGGGTGSGGSGGYGPIMP